MCGKSDEVKRLQKKLDKLKQENKTLKEEIRQFNRE
jgi:cell division protein FtsB